MDIEMKRSRRKTLAIEVTQDARVLVRAPYGMPPAQIEAFVHEKSEWIEKSLQKVQKQQERREQTRKLTAGQLHALADKALEVFPERVQYFAQKIGVDYGRITIRNQRTRWGSCSSRGNLNFNCLLMLAPREVRDYVIVHELCHRKEMNHSERFWKEVERILPDYRLWRTWLKEHGKELLDQME